MSTIYQIKVTLNDSKPPIWRRILVADTTTLLQLHDILQIVMGWADYHLHMFTINGQIYGNPEDDEMGFMKTKNESRFKLNQLVGREGLKFRYEYDFGDGWLHDLLVEKILPAEKGAYYPICVTGKRACPPEDSGGVGGDEEILEARANPKHPQHREYKEWIGENFDPEHFDLDEVNKVLRNPRSRREADPVINGQDDSQSPTAGEEILVKIVTWVSGLDEKQLALTESLAVRRDMVAFLSYLNDNRVIGTQSTGNLPLKAVREICAKFVNPPVLDEKMGDKIYKLRSEDDVWQLFYLHMLANTGGLVTGGQARTWKVTPSGNSFLTAPAPIQLGFMLDVWWHYEDWRIAFPVSGLSEGLPSDFNKITLKRLRELPVGKSVSYEPFADQLIKETRFTWPSIDQTFVNITMHSAIERMVILPLVEFGVIESEKGMKDIGGSKFSKLSKICLTSFGKGLLEVL
jgi:hypothetical protein